MASKRQLKAVGITVNTYVRANQPNNHFHRINPDGQAAPNYNPETLTRQQVRQMLRVKAHKDVLQQYGRIGANGRFVGFVGFSRRGRRRVEMAISHRWYKQIVAEQKRHNETSRARGWIKSLIRKATGEVPANTLASSGVAGR